MIRAQFRKFPTEAPISVHLAHKLIASGYRLRCPRLRMRDALDVTRTTHKSAIKWVAPLIRLVGQLHAAILTNVAIHMEVFVHRDYPDRLLSPLNWRDSLSTRRALGRKHSVVIVYTIDLIVDVDREGHAVEAFVAHATPEAARVIRLAHGLQYLWGARRRHYTELQWVDLTLWMIMLDSRRLPFP